MIGCGSSAGVPEMNCVRKGGCKVCLDALLNPNSLNVRRNSSILLCYQGRSLLIDCGKTFRDAMLRCQREHNIKKIDAVLITHAHADAILGIDDLREWSDEVLPLYMSETDFPVLVHTFPYLVKPDTADTNNVAKLKFITFEPSRSFFPLPDLCITPVLVNHGKVSCVGYHFLNVLYLSDVKYIEEETYTRIGKLIVEVLIIDALFKFTLSSSHVCLIEVLEIIRRIQPNKTYLTGLSHDFDYHQDNAWLREVCLRDIELLHDGMILPITSM